MKQALEEFVHRITAAAGANLESIVLYGSAARDDFNEKYSDVNLLCVVREVSAATLDQLGPVVDWWSKNLGHRPPLFITAQELSTSADVFAIETLDIKATHRILHGADVLAAIEVPMNLHRVQVEHELRTVLLRLRQHYLLSPSDDQELEAVLAKSVSTVITLLRHSLIVVGHTEVPRAKRSVLEAVAQAFSLDVAAVAAALDLRDGRRLEASARTVYQKYMQCLATTIARIDEAAPKKQWQRVALESAPPSTERIG